VVVVDQLVDHHHVAVVFADWRPETLADLVDLLHTGQACGVGSRLTGLRRLLQALGIQLTGLEAYRYLMSVD
jgi:hypothetical protein